MMGSIEAKLVIPQHATKHISKPSKLECYPAEYESTKKDKKRRFNGEVVNQFGGLAFCRVCKHTSPAGIVHALDVGVHPQPIVA